MKNLHPSPGAGDGRVEPRNATPAPYERREEVIRCPHCGMPNNKLTATEPDTLGNSSKIVAVSMSTDAGVVTKYEKQVTAGCRNCGLHFEKSTYTTPLFSTVNLQGR